MTDQPSVESPDKPTEGILVHLDINVPWDRDEANNIVLDEVEGHDDAGLARAFATNEDIDLLRSELAAIVAKIQDDIKFLLRRGDNE